MQEPWENDSIEAHENGDWDGLGCFRGCASVFLYVVIIALCVALLLKKWNWL